jgi:uncharacterized protein
VDILTRPSGQEEIESKLFAYFRRNSFQSTVSPSFSESFIKRVFDRFIDRSAIRRPNLEMAKTSSALTHPWKSALVTGASSGIGASIARLLGAAGIPTVIVARRGDRLESMAEQMPTLEPLVADLGTPGGRAAVATRLTDGLRPVELLVNNAGFGVAGTFAEVAVDRHAAMIELNITALTELTRAALSPMIAAHRGWILQVSSVASFQPGPTSATYSATKAFVTSLSEALFEELRGSGVNVTALCPGFTRTEFHEHSGADDTTMDRVPRAAWLNADVVAASGLRAVAGGRALDVPGVAYKGLAGLSAVLPRSAARRLMGLGAKNR